MADIQEPLTTSLRAAHAGDRQAADRVYALLYPELLKIARARLHAHQRNTQLDTQALVHESFMRFIGGQKLAIEDRRHFFTYAAKMMRNIIIDFARRQQAGQRGGDLQRVTLDTGLAAQAVNMAELLDIDRALHDLGELDARLAQVVEMRYFGGYEDTEIAAVLGVTERSVQRYWVKARAFLVARLGG